MSARICLSVSRCTVDDMNAPEHWRGLPRLSSEPGRADRRLFRLVSTIILGAAAAVFAAAALWTAPAAHADIDGVHCAYNVWAGHWVATVAQPGGGPPVFIGYCDGGLRTPPQANYGRLPGE